MGEGGCAGAGMQVGVGAQSTETEALVQASAAGGGLVVLAFSIEDLFLDTLCQ